MTSTRSPSANKYFVQQTAVDDGRVRASHAMQNFFGFAAQNRVKIPMRPPMAAQRQWGTDDNALSYRTAALAALFIQRMWRGRRGRDRYEDTWDSSQVAALVIQSWYRSRLLAKWLAREREVVLTKTSYRTISTTRQTVLFLVFELPFTAFPCVSPPFLDPGGAPASVAVACRRTG